MRIRKINAAAALIICGVTGICQGGHSILSTTFRVQGLIDHQVIYEISSDDGGAAGAYYAESGSNTFFSQAGAGGGFFCRSEIYFPDAPEAAVDNKIFTATASSTITFQPHGNLLEIFTDGAAYEGYNELDYAGGWMYIANLSEEQVIYSFGANEGFGWDMIPINPDHVYMLYIYFETSGILPVLYNGGYIHAEFTIIPEPCTLLLLCSGGFVMRRKRPGPPV